MIQYRNYTLARGSQAAELHEKREFEKLDRHLKEVDAAHIKRQGGPTNPDLINYRAGDHPKDWK